MSTIEIGTKVLVQLGNPSDTNGAELAIAKVVANDKETLGGGVYIQAFTHNLYLRGVSIVRNGDYGYCTAALKSGGPHQHLIREELTENLSVIEADYSDCVTLANNLESSKDIQAAINEIRISHPELFLSQPTEDFNALKAGVVDGGRVLVSTIPTVGTMEMLIPHSELVADNAINFAMTISKAVYAVYGIPLEVGMKLSAEAALVGEPTVAMADEFMSELALDGEGAIDTFYYKGVPVLRSATYSTTSERFMNISKLLPRLNRLPEGITVKSIRPSK